MGYTTDSTKVKAHLFNPHGKWKYEVVLDYDFPEFDYEDWNLWYQARQALKNGAEKHTSGVSIKELGPGWMLVVEEPYGKNSHPIMVIGEVSPQEMEKQ